ncbi:MAG: galactokinase family protein [Planctomycetota bacterium]
MTANLRDWQDQDQACEALRRRGMTPDGARRHAEWLTGLAQAAHADGLALDTPVHAVYCPGRLEVLGKHTDYGGGRSLVAAPELGIVCLAWNTAAPEYHATSRAETRPWQVSRAGLTGELPEHWGRYPQVVAARLERLGLLPPGGAQLRFAASLPLAAGMSSSSALLVTTARVLLPTPPPALEPFLTTPEQQALFAACLENGSPFGPLAGDRGVGTFGGSEDHTAMSCSRPSEMVCASYDPTVVETRLPVPTGHRFWVVQSGVTAEKAFGAREAYNRLSQTLNEVAQIARRLAGPVPDRDPNPDPNPAPNPAPSLAALLRAGAIDRDSLAAELTRLGRADLRERFLHFHDESEVWLPAACVALETGRTADFAAIAHRSSEASFDRLGNQVPETRWVTDACHAAGALCASPFGAGFGGSVWALVPEGLEAEFRARLEKAAHEPWQSCAAASAQPIALGPPLIAFSAAD